MSYENEVEAAGLGFSDRIATSIVRVTRFVLRMFLVLLLGIAFGAAVYYAAPALYKSYIEPLQANSQSIADLEAVVAKIQSDARDRATESGERLVTIEGRLAEQNEALAELQAEVESLQTAQAGQGEEVDELQELAGRVEAMKTDQKKLADDIDALATALDELSSADSPTEHLNHQLQLIRVMELLTRSRLWLAQNNFGLASQDIEVALGALEDMAEAAPDERVAILTPIIERLDMALEALPGSPVIAADDLEVAWRLLVSATELSPISPE